MAGPSKNDTPGPELTPETLRRIDILFLSEDRERARTLLYEQCGKNLPFGERSNALELERIRFAALKCSDGNLLKLEKAVKLAQVDWRDLLMASGFAHDIRAHRSWQPKPAGEPAEIDPLHLAAAIHARLATLLAPLGFEREGDEWRRGGDVPQSVRLQTGMTSRMETRFFLHVTLHAERVVVLHLPKLPRLDENREQGYMFRAHEDPKILAEAVAADVIRYAQPLLERFTTASEVRRGFEDGTFRLHLPVEGQVWLF